MSTRLDKLHARRIDPSLFTAKLLNESWRSIQQSESVRYVVGAMQPIDPDYTANTFLQGERVKNQLEKVLLSPACDYKYQGSTTNDTHIKAASDIDLLVITGKYHALEPPQVPTPPYKGDPIQDLTTLRSDAEKALRNAFPAAMIDVTGSKSISLVGGSLTRKVDVVPANWHNTVKYAETGHDFYRGVEIFDSHAKRRISNSPFLHNQWIQYQDEKTQGGLRKAARLMKSLKFDSESIDLSSYDIVSIAFNIPAASLNVPKGSELQILNACHEYVTALSQDQSLRESINVPDGHRKVFASGHATAKGLDQLKAELDRLSMDVLRENQRSFKKLAEARVAY
jgi:hypothetical protein